MIEYINQLITEYNLASGNSRWPPVYIEENEISTALMGTLTSIKMLSSNKG